VTTMVSDSVNGHRMSTSLFRNTASGFASNLDGDTKGNLNAVAPQMRKPVFVNAKEMKEKLREKMHKPVYDVRDFYKDKGVCQRIARSGAFENATLMVIGANALWIAIDCDHNNADVLMDAHPIFIIAENMFCLYFFWEWTVRFISFKRKLNCFRDRWFVFDSMMVMMIVTETWVMTILLVCLDISSGGGLGNAGLLRLLRLMRLSRMARMARLLRSMPELLILVKGMLAAVRSVMFTLLLLFLLIYVFAILFRQLTKDTLAGDEKFYSIPRSFNTLVMNGVLLDSVGSLMQMLEEEGIILMLFLYVFILLSALTVMNMLIGVLCEVVSAVADAEHEELTIIYVRERLVQFVDKYRDSDGEVHIKKGQFLDLIQEQDAVRLLNEIDVDVFGMVDLVDTIFASEDGSERILTFGDLVELMLEHRETATCTVKDITDLRKYVRGRADRLEDDASNSQTRLRAQTNELGRRLEKLTGAEQGSFVKDVDKVESQLKELVAKRKEEDAMERQITLQTEVAARGTSGACLEPIIVANQQATIGASLHGLLRKAVPHTTSPKRGGSKYETE